MANSFSICTISSGPPLVTWRSATCLYTCSMYRFGTSPHIWIVGADFHVRIFRAVH